MIEHYSSNIQNAIQRELFKAKSSIKIAVAWFTNELLFAPLLLKLDSGVKVEIILNNDDINRNTENDIDFSDFVNKGGVIRWNSSNRLMHDKFCIIDEEVVIFGSYNWTYRAEFNDETITISRNEINTTNFYIKQFNLLCTKYPSQNSKDVNGGTKQNKSFSITQLSHSSIVPTKIQPYLKLNFYDKVSVRCTIPDNMLYCFASENQYRLCLLDSIRFLPSTDFMFEDYLLIQRDANGNIWLKIDGLWGLYNISSKRFIINPQYESVCYGKYENVTIFAAKKNGKMGGVDNLGRIRLPFIYSKIYVHTDNFIELEKDNKHGLWCSGRIIFECKFDVLYTDGIYPSRLDEKFGVIKGTKIIIPFEFDSIKYVEPFGHGYHYLEKNGKWGRHDCWTGKVIPCIYNSMEEADAASKYY